MLEVISRLDKVLLLCLFFLACLGIATVYSAVHEGDIALWQRQNLYWLLGITVMFGLCFIPLRVLAMASWPVFVIAIICLALVPFIGDAQMGARRWLNMGIIHIQPSEIMKWALVLILAHWFALREASSVKNLALPLLLMLVPAMLIIRQPDLGTALVLILASGGMLLAAGLPWRWLAYAAGTAVAGLPILWFSMHTYQKRRILSFLDPESDPLGAGYHVIQSTIAIGSGGIFGKGYLQGTQSRLHFLPEQHTDFILAALAEEGGLILTLILFVLYGILLFRLLAIAERASTRFGSLLCMGITTLFMLYACINIGMVSGVLPVVGVPLPFISYGGSALVTMLAALGVAMRVGIESHGHIPWQRPGSPFA